MILLDTYLIALVGTIILGALAMLFWSRRLEGTKPFLVGAVLNFIVLAVLITLEKRLGKKL